MALQSACQTLPWSEYPLEAPPTTSAPPCLRDHAGARANPDSPGPGEGEVDHGAMLRTLAAYGFRGPVAVERFEGQHVKAEMSPELLRDLAARAR